jgi:hypothetical protein
MGSIMLVLIAPTFSLMVPSKTLPYGFVDADIDVEMSE